MEDWTHELEDEVTSPPQQQQQLLQRENSGSGSPENDASVPTKPSDKKRKKAPGADAASKKPRVQENRAIYVTNLPLDATLTEIDEEFSKYGIIDQSLEGTKRIKMYTDEQDKFKGEALIVYFKKESVEMAIRMMDDSWFRPGGANIHVQEADRSFKKIQDGDQVAKSLVRKDRKANERARAEMNRRLAEWSDDDPDVLAKQYAPRTNKWAKFVIVRHAFTFEELDKDPAALSDIKEDMREEGEEYGEVTKVVLYDKEPSGVVAIRFKEPASAEAFKNRIDGRSYDGRVLKAEVATDRPKFKKSSKHEPISDEED